MRICVIGPTYPFRGGIAHYTTLLYRALRERHEVRFIAFRRQYPKWLFPGETDRDPSARSIVEPGAERVISSYLPWSWFAAAWRVVMFRPRIVVIPWWVGFWAPVFWTMAMLVRILTDARIVYLCHNVVAHEAGRFDRVATALALATGHGFVVHSQEDCDNLRAILPLAVVRKSPHPTYEAFAESGLTRDEARRRLEIEPGENVILFFGFVRPYKGLDVLLKALPGVTAAEPVRLMVVGEFWKGEDETRALIDDLGVADRVTLVNRYVPNEEVETWFAAADVVALPYRSATGSGICQVAFGHGRAVVATSVGCLPEVVLDGRTGLVVPPGDPAALADALIRFFRDGLRDRFEAAVVEDRDRFSWRHMVDAIEGFAGDVEDRR